MLRSRLVLAALLAGAVLGNARPTHAQAVGGGPTLGYTIDSGFTLGWEVAGTPGLLYPFLMHVVAGGSYRLTPGDGATFHHYVAWEPWLGLGATLGVAVDDRWSAAFAGGVWEAVPIFVRDIREQEAYEAVPAWMITMAIGVRSLGDGLEIYAAPKLQWVMRIDVNT